MDDSKTTVSVVIPVYGRRAELKRAVRSALAQAGKFELEILVCDDGSPEPAATAVADLDDRIRVIRSNENRGAAAARNLGLDAADGAFVAFLDSDDEWLPGKLEAQIGLLARDDSCVASVCGYYRVTEDMTRIVVPETTRWTHEDLLRLRVKGWATPLIVVRRAGDATSVRFDERLPANQDWDYLYRLSQLGEVCTVRTPFVRMNRDTDPHVASAENVLASRLVLHEKYGVHLRRDRIAANAQHLRTALAYVHMDTLGGARWHLRRAVMAKPTIAGVFLWSSSYLGRKAFRAAMKLAPMRK